MVEKETRVCSVTVQLVLFEGQMGVAAKRHRTDERVGDARPTPDEFDRNSSFFSLPEKALLLAILMRAMLDYSGCSKGSASRKKTNRKSAWVWFTEPQGAVYRPFSFLWICEHLDIDPRAVIRFLREGGDAKMGRWSLPQDLVYSFYAERAVSSGFVPETEH